MIELTKVAVNDKGPWCKGGDDSRFEQISKYIKTVTNKIRLESSAAQVMNNRLPKYHNAGLVFTSLTLAFLGLFADLSCADSAMISDPPSVASVIFLWPESSINSTNSDKAEEVVERGKGNHDRTIRNITSPSLEYYPTKSANGAAVVVIPGGGYYFETMDKEGRDIARWFNSIGVSAFVLKYRLPNSNAGRLGTAVPLQDAQRAVRMVRRRATEWGVRPDKIGVIGFSAGGHLASTVGTQFDLGHVGENDPVQRVSCRPDFQILIYPVISMDSSVTHSGSRKELLGENPSADLVRQFSSELNVTSNTPPVFLLSTSDDFVKTENSLLFYAAARKAGVPAELHIFEKGGHGYGLHADTRPGANWPKLCETWLHERGVITDSPK